MGKAGENNRGVRVLIADRQPLFRAGVRAVLKKSWDMEVLAEVSSTSELFSFLKTTEPDVLLLATDLSDEEGPAVARSVKQMHPGVAVVMLTSQPSDEDLFESIRSRASGYLLRDVAPEDLLDTVQRASRGQHPINETMLAKPRVAARLLQQFQDLSWGQGLDNIISTLTERETEVLNYLAKGMTNREIAAALNISEQTMKNHVTSILRKLNANARTEAVVIAVKYGLIKLS
jgi:two-component system response regulator DegU